MWASMRPMSPSWPGGAGLSSAGLAGLASAGTPGLACEPPAGGVLAPASRPASERRSATTRYAWASASPTRRRAHSASRPARCGSVAMAPRTRAITKSACPVSARTRSTRSRVCGSNQFRHRPVEVRSDPVPYIGLDQPLEPVSRGGAGVEGIQRRGERQHRLLWLGAQRRQMLAQQPEVAELGGRHPGQGGLVGERGGERRVLGQPEIGVQFRVGQEAEQVDDPLIRDPPLRARLGAAAHLAGLAGRIVAPLCFGHPRSVTTEAPRVGQPAGQDTLVHCESEPGMECGNPLPCSPSSRARGQPSRQRDGHGRTRRWQDPAARPPAQRWPDALLRWRARPAGGADSQVRSGRDTRLGRAQTAGH